MKVLIIDDEPKARNLLTVLVKENCPKITEIIQAENLQSGIKLIKKQMPNIVFLDIEMPEHSGLEILNFIDKENYNFEIIFTTAYSEYAIQAFQFSAIDYLLKPIRPSQVKEAVNKAVTFLNKNQINQRLAELKKGLEENNFKKIGLPYDRGIKFVNLSDIISLQADGMYTRVSTINEEEILVSKPLKFFIEILFKIKTFYRPHRSYLINLSYIKEYIKQDGGYIIMENNNTISVSKDRKEEFLTIVQNI